MVSVVSGTGQVEDQKMMKDNLIDGEKLWVGLEVNWWRWLEMLVVLEIFLMSFQINV